MFRVASVSSIRSRNQSPKSRFATAVRALPTWSDPVGLGAKRTRFIPRVNLHSPSVQAALLEWFQANGRDLPWRAARDPYAILVSEGMLQQTQVARVRRRWLAC